MPGAMWSSYSDFYRGSRYAAFPQEHRHGRGGLAFRMILVEQGPHDFTDPLLPETILALPLAVSGRCDWGWQIGNYRQRQLAQAGRMLVVPAGIMDSKNGRAFRERMLTKGEFLGAQRMPNTAFEASHTDVTADVIYLRKRPDDVAGALGTLTQADLQRLGVWDDEFLAGSYFAGRGRAKY